MLVEGRRQWMKKFLSGVLGVTGLAALGSTVSSEEAHATARSLLPDHGTEMSDKPCNFSCSSYCPQTHCPNCYQATYIPNVSGALNPLRV